MTACQVAPSAVEATRPAAITAEALPPVVTALPEPDTVVATAIASATAMPSPTTVASPTLPPPTIEPVVTVEVTRPPLGTADRPIQLLFPPLTSSAIISQRGQVLADALSAATGAEFAVGIADSEQAVVELLCAAPGDVIAFVSPAAYTIAHDQCDARAGLVAVDSNGLTSQLGMLVTSRDDGPVDLAGLEGQRWATADQSKLPTYLYFRALLADAGVTPGDINSKPEETSALLTLLDDTADFTTATYVPPLMPFDRIWNYGMDDPEEWRALGVSPTRSPIGYVIVAWEPEVGGYRLRDARARLFDTHPEIYDSTRVVAISEPIPNATVVLGADFPAELSRDILATLPEFAASESCQSSLCSADLYGWTGLQPIEDTDYDPIRFIIEKLEIEPAALWDLIG